MMPGTKEHSGGARRGTGPVRRRYTLSIGVATMLRELTRSKLMRRDVTEEELMTEIEIAIKMAVDRRLAELEPSGE